MKSYGGVAAALKKRGQFLESVANRFRRWGGAGNGVGAVNGGVGNGGGAGNGGRGNDSGAGNGGGGNGGGGGRGGGNGGGGNDSGGNSGRGGENGMFSRLTSRINQAGDLLVVTGFATHLISLAGFIRSCHVRGIPLTIRILNEREKLYWQKMEDQLKKSEEEKAKQVKEKGASSGSGSGSAVVDDCCFTASDRKKLVRIEELTEGIRTGLKSLLPEETGKGGTDSEEHANGGDDHNGDGSNDGTSAD